MGVGIPASSNQNRSSAVAHTKRFFERYRADPDFRRQLRAAPQETVERYGIDVDAEALRPLWGGGPRPSGAGSPAVEEYLERLERMAGERHQFQLACTPSHPHFRAWRERQINRIALHAYSTPGEQDSTLTHSPVCFELTQGCSVGCWFCSLAAAPLSGVFTYTGENARLWCKVLEVVREIIGPAAGHGICYWATEPFDNPDYERLCEDFERVLGAFPQTTTALPLQDLERTRSLLERSDGATGMGPRFSILSLGVLNRVHEAFSAADLADVELILQNREANLVKCASGRFREHIRRTPEAWDRERAKMQGVLEAAGRETDAQALDAYLAARTTACVSGFLFNMVERTIRLVSPCLPDDRHPLGFITFDEGRFSDAAEARALMERMIEARMPPALREKDRVLLGTGMSLELLPHGFQVATKAKSVRFESETSGPYLRALGEALTVGQRTAGEIALVLSYTLRAPESLTMAALSRMLAAGVLDEEI